MLSCDTTLRLWCQRIRRRFSEQFDLLRADAVGVASLPLVGRTRNLNRELTEEPCLLEVFPEVVRDVNQPFLLIQHLVLVHEGVHHGDGSWAIHLPAIVAALEPLNIFTEIHFLASFLAAS